ncbi:MAG: DUF4136 domain-containing protein [Steroidobacteraceae bacterium]|jgi:hypothetical protein|nr:DUF4136 domain-containing protein [Steroidobacteraceae bacterium]
MRFLILAAALLLAACAAPPQLVVSQPGTDPATLSTFAFRSWETATTAGGGTQEADARLGDLVRQQLVAKGYVPAAEGARPDFIVTYRAAMFVHEGGRDVYSPVRDPTAILGQEVAFDPAGQEGLVREGTFVLMALGGADEKVLWQATASGATTTRREFRRGILTAARAMLERFPARR